MKKVLASLVLPVLMVTGCTDNAYERDNEDDKGASYSLPVRVSVGSPSVKGGSAVERFEDMVGKDIYVYAFRKHEKASYSVTSAEDPSVCLIDASSEQEPGNKGGKAACLTGTSFYAEWKDGNMYWPSGDRHKDAYDFFAYFIDDAKVSQVIRTDDKVDIRFRIDGSQDIMVSKASLTASQLSGLNDADKEKASEYSYSHFTALRSILPVFTFSHTLVRLDFEAVAGDVTGVSVLSARDAVLTVASKDESGPGISFADNVELLDDDAALQYALALPGVSGGRSLLVAPAGRYKIYVTVNRNGVPVIRTGEISDRESGKPFVSGERYAVRLSLDGEEVVAETELK